MPHYFRDAIKPFLLVYIVYIQVIVINSKTSILWKVNVQNGKIDGFGEEKTQVNKIRYKMMFLVDILIYLSFVFHSLTTGLEICMIMIQYFKSLHQPYECAVTA